MLYVNYTKKINHNFPIEELANNIEIDHDLLFRQIFPYLSNEGYIKIRTADTLNITEEGLDKMDSLLHY